MTDKEAEIAGFIIGALKAGYKITLEGPNIGAAKGGVHMHVGYLDELLDEIGHINPWDYINERLKDD